MFTFLYGKFTQDNMYQILSQSVRFCRLYIKKHFGVFFGSQCRCNTGQSGNCNRSSILSQQGQLPPAMVEAMTDQSEQTIISFNQLHDCIFYVYLGLCATRIVCRPEQNPVYLYFVQILILHTYNTYKSIYLKTQL